MRTIVEVTDPNRFQGSTIVTSIINYDGCYGVLDPASGTLRVHYASDDERQVTFSRGEWVSFRVDHNGCFPTKR